MGMRLRFYQGFWHTIKLYLFGTRVPHIQSPWEIANGNQTIVITAQSNQSIKKSMTVSQAPPTKLHTPPILTSQTALRPLEKVQSGIKQCTSVQRINISWSQLQVTKINVINTLPEVPKVSNGSIGRSAKSTKFTYSYYSSYYYFIFS